MLLMVTVCAVVNCGTQKIMNAFKSTVEPLIIRANARMPLAG
jgi:hypothetical protein